MSHGVLVLNLPGSPPVPHQRLHHLSPFSFLDLQCQIVVQKQTNPFSFRITDYISLLECFLYIKKKKTIYFTGEDNWMIFHPYAFNFSFFSA